MGSPSKSKSRSAASATAVARVPARRRDPGPLDELDAELAKQLADLGSKRAAIAAVIAAAAACKPLFARWAELADLFARQVEHAAAQAVPGKEEMRRAKMAVVEDLLDRLDEEFRRTGAQDVADPATGETAFVVRGGLARLMELIDPEQFAPRPAPADPVGSAPASPERVEEYRGRTAAGEELFSPSDDNDLHDAVVVERKNGAGKKVLGRKGGLEKLAAKIAEPPVG